MLRVNYSNIILWSIAIILYKVFKISVVYYAVFLIVCFYILKNEKHLTGLLQILVLSILLPDNYTSIIIGIFVFVIYIIRNIKILNVIEFILIIFFGFGWIINFVPITNILMEIMYIGIFFIFSLLFRKDINLNNRKSFAKLFDEIFVIETFATIVNLVFKISKGSISPDWSTGTMSTPSSVNTMMIIGFICLVRYGYEFYTSRNMKYIPMIIVALYLAYSPSCNAMFYSAVAGCLVFFYLISIIKLKIRYSLVLVAITIVAANIFLSIGDIKLILSDQEYRSYRVAKLATYEDVYINEAKNNIMYAMIGNGPGFGASRAAVICTGNYVPAYKLIFNVSMSDFTQRNIYEKMPYVNDNKNSIINMPYASWLSIMGDFGYVGVILMLIYIVKHFAKKNLGQKVLVIAVSCMAIVDFAYEYPKAMLFFWLAYYLLDDMKRFTYRSGCTKGISH